MNFFHTIVTALLLTILTVSSNGFCSTKSEQQICIADIQLIFQKSNAEKNAKTKLESRQQEMGTILNNLGKEIDELNKSLKHESKILNKETIEEKKRTLRIKINDLKEFRMKFQEELDTLQQQFISNIEKDIINIASKIGKKEGYSLVINKSAILYSSGIIDITDKILKEYNKE